MFKKKFIEFAKSKKGTASFEIVSEKQASKLIGGCGKLSSCGVFRGNCDQLTIGDCGSFYPAIE
ncbi:hypothetical protein [Flavobacterium sp. 245]|uniref:hypothetical protein n=1 Tax=Flavobacterium sp. 245 TaxID=2512115 RepID=UPI00105F5B27|nr:hypothetical protein [Flavobacterium sp. 245]TDP02466.1 hypothetical protein EV145_103456 [Flavobacterium sp. 245]